MSGLSIANKTFLESVLNMTSGYVLDFSNSSFANFFRDLNVDIYDAESYPGFGDSKANRVRALWRSGSDTDVAGSLHALAEYLSAKKDAGALEGEITDEQIRRMHDIAQSLSDPRPEDVMTPLGDSVNASFTTEATVAANKINIEIHEDIYNHIDQYLINGDYFHAVEESYKLVREQLREKTGSERASDAFAPSNQEKIFGHAPRSPVEKDFYEGVKFLNMAIQFLRNEKAHAPASPLEPNLALHYISLASLAYDLITRYVSDEVIAEIEDLIRAKRRSLSATAFYRVFESGRWLDSITLPDDLRSSSVRRVLKEKWLAEAEFTHSYDYSNIMLMRLQVIAEELSKADLEDLIERPTLDFRGNDQEAGMLEFMQYMYERYPEVRSSKVDQWIENKLREYA
ncbi:uncharacterized protein (TIGR02391 family) [Arthrobacter sp. CAN_A214]|uniref:TIGR02391 family protein n=1 Tax=Arthrobacter sp. CAN_A214 TaxID=2787720 RepID=UPI0018C96998